MVVLAYPIDEVAVLKGKVLEGFVFQLTPVRHWLDSRRG